MLETAEAIDVSLNINDIAEKLGHEPSPWYRRQGKQDARWDAVFEAQHAEASHADQERMVGHELAVWLEDMLTAEERDGIYLRPASHVDDDFLMPVELVAGEGEAAKIFALGQSFDFVGSAPAVPSGDGQEVPGNRLRSPNIRLLPETVQNYLDEKHAFWNTLGVHNGGELEEFVDTYFTHTDVDPNSRNQPAEIEWLFASLPETQDMLAHAAGIRLRKLAGVPPAVRAHIHTVSQSQNKLISWLRPYVTESQPPIIHDTDRIAVENRRVQRIGGLHHDDKLGEFRRWVLTEQTNQAAEADGDFNTALSGITNFAEIAYGVEIAIPGEMPEKTRSELLVDAGYINEHLDEEFGKASALEHMLQDVSSHHSEGILKTLKLAGGLILTGEAMHLIYDHHPEWTPLAVGVFLLALMEDPVSEAGEAFSQRSLGYSWAEIAPRYKLIAPIAVGSILAGLTVKHVGDTYGESWAALDFAIASCATTGATLYKTLQTSMNAYRRQVAEGKVPELPSDEPVPFSKALHEGWDESFGDNPARKGKLAGMVAMIGSGPLPPVAHAVFTQAAATMSFSMGEPAAGIAATYAHKWVKGPLAARRIRAEARRLREQSDRAATQDTA